MPIDIRNFEVPETPYRESNVIPQLTEQLMQKRRYDYQIQRENDADQWKKLGLIQDLTDLSRHQTGSDVANAVGNQKAADIFQKYVGVAGQTSPNELAANIQKDMSGLVSSMGGIKTELTNADAQMGELKKIYPNIDVASLTRDYRADILNRHMKNGVDFHNPIEVQPTQIDLSNPKSLAKYLPNTKNLDDAISNPKGLDPNEVMVGSPYENITYKGKMPFWMKPNFTDEDRAKNGGYLKKGFIPKLEIKSENLPSEFLPALKDNPRKMVDYDTYKQFYNQHPIDVEKATADMFGDAYNKMSDHEKELAQRDMLYTKISTLDKNNLYPSASTHPSASMIKIWSGGGSGSGNSGENINNLYGRIQTRVHENAGKGMGTRFNALAGDEQTSILDYANKDRNESNKISPDDLWLKEGDNGAVEIYRIDDTHGNRELRPKPQFLVTTMPYIGTNLKVQPNVKSKNAVVEKGNQQPTVLPHSEGYSRSELKQAKWTDAQIEAAVKAGKIKVHD